MVKSKTTYVCQSCGASFMRWMGRCSECGEWNTIAEEEVSRPGNHKRLSLSDMTSPVSITEQVSDITARISTGSGECDRVLGGGIVPGSLTLIGGDPGIGKSTLMLQVSHFVAEEVGKVLYVSGEESFAQARLRARRLGRLAENLFILPETELSRVRDCIRDGEYSLVVVDSIQSMYSSDLEGVPGSVAQVRECANEFLRLAKGCTIPIFLVGHVTKDGAIAGPRLLEHLVDTVLYFEGEGRHALRILRSVKNRFGSTYEIGVFEMTEQGLCEVPDPSALFLSERARGASGSVVFPSMEGTRPLLVEVQGLVGEPAFGSPRRTVSGVNGNRVALILAVLEKRAAYHFSDRDVFVNVAGGVRLDEPASDLAVALALVSSLLDKPLPENLAVFGEVGLAGEIRAADMARRRVAEVGKFGFSRCLVPKSCAKDIDVAELEIVAVGKLTDAIEAAFC